MKKKVIITVATTGGLHNKTVNPNLPEKPEEIAEEAYRCYNEGAAIIHIHAREPQGLPSSDPAIYSHIHQLIRQKCNIVLADTTGGGPNLTLEERIKCIEADPKPEIASLNMGTMMRVSGKYAGLPFLNPRSEIERFTTEMVKRNIKPELEVYSHSMFRDVNNLIEKNLIKPPYLINLVLGMEYQGAVDATPKYLYSLLDFAPPGVLINVTAIGAAQLPLTTMAMILGCMVRVGMEDNIYYRRGQPVKGNAELVSRTVRIAKELELEIASPDEARIILGLDKK